MSVITFGRIIIIELNPITRVNFLRQFPNAYKFPSISYPRDVSVCINEWRTGKGFVWDPTSRGHIPTALISDWTANSFFFDYNFFKEIGRNLLYFPFSFRLGRSFFMPSFRRQRGPNRDALLRSSSIKMVAVPQDRQAFRLAKIRPSHRSTSFLLRITSKARAPVYNIGVAVHKQTDRVWVL